MQITRSTGDRLLSVASPGENRWQVGQVLQATVVSVALSGRAVIEVEGVRLLSTVAPDSGLQPGKRLELEVIGGTVPLVLKVITAPRQGADLLAALRNLLPRQLPLDEMLNQLVSLSGGNHASSAEQRMLAEILAMVPDFGKLLSGKELKRAIADSGHFLEGKLADSEPSLSSLNRDFKAALLRILDGLRESPSSPLSSAAQLLEGGVARLQINQLNSVIARDGAHEWLVELPVVADQGGGFTTLRLQIRRDNGRQVKKHSPSWSLYLEFELQQLGLVQVNLALLGENQISVRIWSQQEQTIRKFRKYRETLHTNLNEAGLMLVNFSCHQGRTTSGFSPKHHIRQQLVDVTA